MNRSEENKKLKDRNKKKLAFLLPIGSGQSKPESLLTSLKVSKMFGFSYGGRKKFSSCMMKSYYCRNNTTYWKAFRLKNESFLWYLYLFPSPRRIKLNIISVMLYFQERWTSNFNLTWYTLGKVFHITFCEWTMTYQHFRARKWNELSK